MRRKSVSSLPRSVAVRVARLMLPCLLALCVLSTSRTALSRHPTPQDRSTARLLAAEGYEALQAGNYALAADRFKRASVLVHAPTILLDLGRSYVGLGRLVEAHEVFQQVLREGVARDAPASWRQALASARKEDALLEPRLAWVTIRVDGADQPRVTLDQNEVPIVSLGVRRAVDPSRRTLVAEAEGFLPVRKTFSLGEGETGEIHLVLKRDPNYAPEGEPKIEPRRGERVIVIEQSPTGQRTPAYIAYGVSAAGVLLGGVSTAFMLLARADLEVECPAGSCPARAADDLSRYRTFGTLAAVGLATGLAGAGVGTYFLLSQKPKDEGRPRSELTVQLSPGYVGVSGRF